LPALSLDKPCRSTAGSSCLDLETVMTDLSAQNDTPKSWDRPAGASLESWMSTRIARYETRKYDWDALKFQADYDPKFRRAQMRYIGTGGTGISTDMNTIPSEHFTFSTMVIPAGHEGPPHLHIDVEEVFFVLRGKLKVVLEKDGERFETILTDRDVISVPPGVYREEINIGDEDALMCVMLGAKKPITPTYPPEHPLASIKRG
jgi:mannose-6-phosphate isomerase-like protein (cupin superfamily)